MAKIFSRNLRIKSYKYLFHAINAVKHLFIRPAPFDLMSKRWVCRAGNSGSKLVQTIIIIILKLCTIVHKHSHLSIILEQPVNQRLRSFETISNCSHSHKSQAFTETQGINSSVAMNQKKKRRQKGEIDARQSYI